VNCDRFRDTGATHSIVYYKFQIRPIVFQILKISCLPALNSFVQNRIRSFDITSRTFKFGDDGSKVPVRQAYKL